MRMWLHHKSKNSITQIQTRKFYKLNKNQVITGKIQGVCWRSSLKISGQAKSLKTSMSEIVSSLTISGKSRICTSTKTCLMLWPPCFTQNTAVIASGTVLLNGGSLLSKNSKQNQSKSSLNLRSTLNWLTESMKTRSNIKMCFLNQ